MTKDQLPTLFLTGCTEVKADVVTHSNSGSELAAATQHVAEGLAAPRPSPFQEL